MPTKDWPIIGIDLGTTYSCVAIWKSENQRAEIIVNESGDRVTPSMVAFTEHDRVVGVPAKNQATRNPRNTVYDSKRLIGKKCSDASIENDRKNWPFKLVSRTGDRPFFDVEFKGERKQFSPEQISAEILSHMKKVAEDYLRCSVENAVVTVPAYFNDSQRCATIDAAKIAGLTVKRIINEPTAAALAYGLEKINSGDVKKKNVLIFDLGGGTFDVTLLEIERGIVEVKAKSGNNHLGGQDFDNRLMDHLAKEFERKCKVDISRSPRAILRLKTKCEQVKRMLSTTHDQVVCIESLYDGMDLDAKITRAKFEDLNADLFQKCIDIVGYCLRDANIDKSRIDDVVLVGGSSRIPKIQALLKEFLSVDSFCKSINPDEAVAYGAAVQAAILGGVRSRQVENIVLQDCTPLSLGIEDYQGIMKIVVPRNTAIPTIGTIPWYTSYDNQKDIIFSIYEGENKMAAANNPLGSFLIYDLKPKPKCKVSFTVTFSIDANSVLTITAVETKTGKIGRTTIHYDRGRLTREEMDSMILEAESYKQEDEIRRQVSMAKNELDQYAYDLKKQIENRRISSQLDAATKEQFQQEVCEAIEWSENNEYRAGPSEYRNKKSSLEKSWQVLKVGLQLAGLAIGFGSFLN